MSVQLLNWRVRLRFPAKTGMSKLKCVFWYDDSTKIAFAGCRVGILTPSYTRRLDGTSYHETVKAMTEFLVSLRFLSER